MGKYIPFRLRPVKDDDIDKGINEELALAAQQLQELDRSDIIRAALRFYFKYKNSIFPSSATNVPSGPSAQSRETHPVVEQELEPQRTSMRAPGAPLLNTNKAPVNSTGTRTGGK